MEKIQPSDLNEYLKERIVIDVRSPAEYAHAHIPTAKNLPLFTNEERAKVGTAYKQVSPEHALLKGLEFVGPKMAEFVKTAIKWSSNRKVVVHCWRGGKRSGSMAWLLRFAGFDVVTIEGGYKNYRQYILQEFDNQVFKFLVLGGKTGSGKTQILRGLAEACEQVIDLEALAHHKGSAFGWIGEREQLSNEQFENDLYTALSQLDPQKPIWIENESRSIGSVFIPKGIWTTMKSAPLIHLEVPFEQRVKHLVDVYTHTSKSDLILSFEKITKRIGQEACKNAIKAIENEDFETAAAIGLKYYDKTYTHSFDNNETTSKHIIQLNNINTVDIIKKLKNIKDSVLVS